MYQNCLERYNQQILAIKHFPLKEISKDKQREYISCYFTKSQNIYRSCYFLSPSLNDSIIRFVDIYQISYIMPPKAKSLFFTSPSALRTNQIKDGYERTWTCRARQTLLIMQPKQSPYIGYESVTNNKRLRRHIYSKGLKRTE